MDIEKRNLLNFLANRNVLPKYGFPTDTVELRTQYADSRIGSRLGLSGTCPRLSMNSLPAPNS
jgi:hypothetical protein